MEKKINTIKLFVIDVQKKGKKNLHEKLEQLLKNKTIVVI